MVNNIVRYFTLCKLIIFIDLKWTVSWPTNENVYQSNSDDDDDSGGGGGSSTKNNSNNDSIFCKLVTRWMEMRKIESNI